MSVDIISNVKTVGIPKVMQQFFQKEREKRKGEKEKQRRHLASASHDASHLEIHTPQQFNSRAVQSHSERHIRRQEEQKNI